MLGKNVAEQVALQFGLYIRIVQKNLEKRKRFISSRQVLSRKKGRVGRKSALIDLEPLRNIPSSFSPT
jgi:hypothetical protein